ncbi:DUF421 domain-containing protein [Christiangramia aquimixticola]|uniref:DUF421 domain-containing protein n=1 Tax=Christiangramia aquimixticola TaxID=1697558 RepID=UPI003AA8B574
MEKWFELSSTTIIAIFFTGLGVYVSIIIFTRIFGKRSFSKMSSFDFAMTVAVGSMIATTVLTKSVSMYHGIAALFFMYLFQVLVALLRRSKIFQSLIDNTPVLLMDRDKILYENLKMARVTESDLRSTLRRANVLNKSEVRAVIFETTGDIVVMKANDTNQEIEDWLLQDVDRK